MKKIMLSLLAFLFAGSVYSQVGINTANPQATLHIEPTSSSNPGVQDGILIPRIRNFPATNPSRPGQIVFLKDNVSLADNFYYWSGSQWLTFPGSGERDIDPTLYAFDGTGFSGSGLTRTLRFTKFKKASSDGFTVSNDEITVGKTGLYLISLTTSVKRTGTQDQQANFSYNVLVNGITKSGTVSSVAAESTSSTSVRFGFMYTLNAGDKLSVTVTKTNEGSTTFSSFGVNSLMLYLIK